MTIMFENRMLRTIFGLKGRKWWEAGEDCIMKSIITCTLHRILLGDLMKEEVGGACSKHSRDEKCVQSFGRKT
jgi:hypothetical protein